MGPSRLTAARPAARARLPAAAAAAITSSAGTADRSRSADGSPVMSGTSTRYVDSSVTTVATAETDSASTTARKLPGRGLPGQADRHRDQAGQLADHGQQSRPYPGALVLELAVRGPDATAEQRVADLVGRVPGAVASHQAARNNDAANRSPAVTVSRARAIPAAPVSSPGPGTSNPSGRRPS